METSALGRHSPDQLCACGVLGEQGGSAAGIERHIHRGDHTCFPGGPEWGPIAP